MTEEQAKGKWCPEAREIIWHDRYGNPCKRPLVTNTEALCIASSCMMWRWEDMANGIPHDKQEASGHCGLGGAP